MNTSTTRPSRHRHRWSRGHRRVLTLLAGLLVAGCSTTVTGQPASVQHTPESPTTGSSGSTAAGSNEPPAVVETASSTRVDTAPSTAPSTPTPPGSNPVGGTTTGGTSQPIDLRAVAPCSYLPDASFDDLADKVVVSLSYLDYDACHLTVATGGGKEGTAWSVSIDLGWYYPDVAAVTGSEPGSYRTTGRRGTDVIAGKTDDGECLRAFQMTGQPVTALIKVNGKTDVCTPADAALDGALSAIAGGHLAEAPWAPDSLARVDLCDRFAPAVRKVLGDAAAGTPIGLHNCTFTGAKGGVIVGFNASPWPPPLGVGADAKPSTVAGHDVLISQSAGNGSFLFIGMVDLGPTDVGVRASHDVVRLMLSGTGDGADRADDFDALIAAVA